ncbi:uncharacterized protein V2V93DRAFT_73267 [Kockiozyma suomiensis]|uniref:uncharacterized protein n=1 Tax=Kockiozyma suomiensis TaxID=1337062 RepID=UPI00334384DB
MNGYSSSQAETVSPADMFLHKFAPTPNHRSSTSSQEARPSFFSGALLLVPGFSSTGRGTEHTTVDNNTADTPASASCHAKDEYSFHDSTTMIDNRSRAADLPSSPPAITQDEEDHDDRKDNSQSSGDESDSEYEPKSASKRALRKSSRQSLTISKGKLSSSSSPSSTSATATSMSSISSPSSPFSRTTRNGGSYRCNRDVPFSEIENLQSFSSDHPRYAYRMLIACALLNAPPERAHVLRVDEIYKIIAERFRYFDITMSARNSWKSGIRHTLSHSVSFKKVDGSYDEVRGSAVEAVYHWTFSDEAWAKQAVLVGSIR